MSRVFGRKHSALHPLHIPDVQHSSFSLLLFFFLNFCLCVYRISIFYALLRPYLLVKIQCRSSSSW